VVDRTCTKQRETKETSISLYLDVDGKGRTEISTGIRLFDHLLDSLCRHGKFDIKISATGDDAHHLVEDVAIVFAHALDEALGDKKGIVRMADATVPMDEALATVAVDISGRGYSVLDMEFEGNDLFGFATDLIRHFMETFAREARITLHGGLAYGTNDHHKAEAFFKALGRALEKATRIDPRIADEIPSTKELL